MGLKAPVMVILRDIETVRLYANILENWYDMLPEDNHYTILTGIRMELDEREIFPCLYLWNESGKCLTIPVDLIGAVLEQN